MKIVLIAPSGAVTSALEQLGTVTDSDEIIVVSRNAPDAHLRSIKVTPSFHGATARAESLLGGSVLGRNVLRLSPFDAGRRFAGAALKSPELRTHVASTDILVVLERDGILAGWRAAKRWASDRARAVYGVPPAQAIIAELRGSRP